MHYGGRNQTAQELAGSIKDNRSISFPSPYLRGRWKRFLINMRGSSSSWPGIVIRVIAPLIKNKHVDPAVVVVDENRRFAISALSGHEEGPIDWPAGGFDSARRIGDHHRL